MMRSNATSSALHRHGRAVLWRRTGWLLLFALTFGFWVLLAPPVAAQSSDADAGTCVGALVGVGLLALIGLGLAKRQRRQVSELSQAVSDASRVPSDGSQLASLSSPDSSADAVGDRATRAPGTGLDLPLATTVMLAEKFRQIRWYDDQHLPVLEPGETVVFHTAVKPLVVSKLKVESSNPRVNLKLDVTNQAYFTGTNRRLIISHSAGGAFVVSKGIDLSIPYGALSDYGRYSGPRQRILSFRPGGTLELEFGLPSEDLLRQHCEVLDDALATILAHYRLVQPTKQP